MGIVGEPATVLDEADSSARFLSALLTERLVRRDDKDELTGRLAEKVPTLESGLARLIPTERAPAGQLAVTFVLRPGLSWQDGEALTSDDVVYAWQRDRLASPGSPTRLEAELVERVEATDSRTAVFYLRPGVRTASYALLARAMPRHILDRADAAATDTYRRRPIHAGPFVIASWQDGLGVTLTPFEGYALGAPALARVEVRFFTDREALLEALGRGEVEMATGGALAADLIPRLERFVESRDLVARYTPQQRADFLLFNMREGPFVKERARRAVAAAIDRRGLAGDVFAGRARVPANYLFAPSWAANEEVAMPDFDPAAGRALLAAAGYCVSTRCRAPVLRARLLVEGGSIPRAAIAELVARDLRNVGVLPTVIAYAPNALAAALAAGDYDLALVSRGGADPAELSAPYLSDSPANVTGYANPFFDALARAAASALTRPERRPLYAELQRLWAADLPGVPLYQHLAVDVAPAALAGVAPTAHGEPLSWNAGAWRFAR